MVTLQTPIRTGLQSMLLEFSSDLQNPTFYIYVDGILVAETQQTQYTLAINAGETVVVEILDDVDTAPMQVFPGKVRLGWFWVDDCDYYRIDEYIDSQWTERKRMPQSNGYLIWESRFLEDGQVHNFRVVPVGTNGNEGQAKEFAVLVVHHPDEPDVDYEYSNATKKITISEA